MLRFDAATKTWSTVTDARTSTIRATAWTVHSTDGTILVADLLRDSIYRHGNGEWTTLDLGTVAPNDLTEAYAIDTNAEGDIFVGTQHGLFVSEDDGATFDWRMQNYYIQEMVVAGDSVIVKNPSFGMLRSVNKGATHEALMLPPGESSFPRKGSDGNLYSGAHRSSDGGATWEAVFDPSDLGLHASPGDNIRYAGDTLYVNEAAFLRGAITPSNLDFAGGMRLTFTAEDAAAAGDPLSIIDLGDGKYLTPTYYGATSGLALFDPTRGEWMWIGIPQDATTHRARLKKLGDGRVALLRPDNVRFSSADGRNFGSPIAVWENSPFGYPPYDTFGLFEASNGSLYASSEFRFCNTQSECSSVFALAKSVDDGASWQPVYEDGPQVLVVAGDVLYGQLTRSTDGGATWLPSDIALPLLGTADGTVLYLESESAPHVLMRRSSSGKTETVGTLQINGSTPTAPFGYYNDALSGPDDEGHVLMLCGAPFPRVCRSESPVF
ncbi:MAG: hypothetical protein KDA60_15545 [Planctomycetales bacterium]|nr:hypothetical protein [Planctomycetales bacterium]